MALILTFSYGNIIATKTHGSFPIWFLTFAMMVPQACMWCLRLLATLYPSGLNKWKLNQPWQLSLPQLLYRLEICPGSFSSILLLERFIKVSLIWITLCNRFLIFTELLSIIGSMRLFKTPFHISCRDSIGLIFVATENPAREPFCCNRKIFSGKGL